MNANRPLPPCPLDDATGTAPRITGAVTGSPADSAQRHDALATPGAPLQCRWKPAWLRAALGVVMSLALLLSFILPTDAAAKTRSPQAEGQIMEMDASGHMVQIDTRPRKATRKKARKAQRKAEARAKRTRKKSSRQDARTTLPAQGTVLLPAEAPGKATGRGRHRTTPVGLPPGRALKILTLNAEHLMSRALAEHWLGWCTEQGWRDATDVPRPQGLPWCEALNGQDTRGRQIFRAVRSMKDHEAKIRQLGELVAQADPDIVLLQEVSDARAVSEILGAGWSIHSTAEQWPNGPKISQNIAVAWRPERLAQSPRIEVVDALSRQGDDGRLTRPGMALHLEARPGLSLAILNVHLKAGCRHGRLERGTSRAPSRQWRRHAACSILQAQVPALEAWLDTQIAAGQQVILSGDFNRSLRDELKLALPARADGSDAASPATPDTISQISSILPELDDGQPAGSHLLLVKNGNYRRHADCHRHIDPFVLSRGLLPWLQQPADDLRVDVLPFAGPISLSAPRPSDHCPHLLTLHWR
ncbi:MAG: hypothetical protein Q4D19_02145 [Lautropia sp.]|nr:hypothetical protein [Lautropia sp.]